MPFREAEDYVHRIGRTGRAGKQSWFLSLTAKKSWLLFKLEKLTTSNVFFVVLSNRVTSRRNVMLTSRSWTLNRLTNRQGRKNNANEEKPDQASAERRLTMMKRIQTVVSNTVGDRKRATVMRSFCLCFHPNIVYCHHYFVSISLHFVRSRRKAIKTKISQ